MGSTLSKITPKRKILAFKRPKLFAPTLTRQVVDESGVLLQEVGKTLADTNIVSTSSFRYDSPGSGMRSTQQLPTDFSKFENHTFFNSAEVNVNVAFDRIINEYPFDGTQQEVEIFLDSLTGFEKYVFDAFPRAPGQLKFSGSYVTVIDSAGASYPSLSKMRTGDSVLDPGLSSLTLEFHLYVPSQSNDNQVILQKRASTNQQFTFALSQSASPTSGTIAFFVTSGSSYLSASAQISKGEFNHLSVVFDRTPGINQLFLYSDATLIASSARSVEMGLLGTSTSSLIIGSGSSIGLSSTAQFVPVETFTGSLDELRFFHMRRDAETIASQADRTIYAQEDLVLYFKFNEPSGSLGTDSAIVLDSSGNSLHSRITNFTHNLRSTGSLPNPMENERLALSPILFPGFPDVLSLNVDLLASASAYDKQNPNLITRIIPPHYLQEGGLFEGLVDEDGSIGDDYTGGDGPGTGKLGEAQIAAAMLYIWAKHFDELKMMVDHFSNAIHVSYDDDESAADQLLPFVFDYYGFDVPNFFSNSTTAQFIDADDISVDGNISTVSLQYVQNQLWRRILINIQEIIRSKGTQHSIRSFLRALGINPDSSLRIREFGGPSQRSLGTIRQKKSEVAALLNMSGCLATVSSSLTFQGVPNNKPFLISGFLSGSRREVGFPAPQGAMVNVVSNPPHGIASNVEDGLFTSGSMTLEGVYKFPNLLTGSYPMSQSLMRLCVTGSGAPNNRHGLVANLVVVSGTNDATVKLIARPGNIVSAPTLELVLTGVNMFDGNQWNVSFGRFRSDDPLFLTFPSSSWFLRCARQSFGDIVESFVTSAFFLSSPAPADVLQNVAAAANVSGAFVTIGSQSISTTGTTFLNDSTVTSLGRVTDFGGKVGQVRFWSKGLTLTEWEEHVTNFKSLGVESPDVNFGFTSAPSGSFGRLRLDVSMDQPVTESDANGILKLFDFTQNNLHMSGSGFEPSISVIEPETFYYSHLSTRLDEAASDNKIRVRGYLSDDNVRRYNTEQAPVYFLRSSEAPDDDTRFTVDFSVTDALDEDIIKIFSTLDTLDNALGDTSSLFTRDYAQLEVIRDVYFNRLTGSMNLKLFFEFFKWFDTSIGVFIEQLIPRKSNYQGTNYVIESHMLERSKMTYLTYEMYLTDTLRRISTVLGESDFVIGNSDAGSSTET